MNANIYKATRGPATRCRRFRRILMMAGLSTFLLGCSTTEQGAGYGGAGGAIIGGALGGWPGAAIGGAAGAAVGAGIGAAKENADATRESRK